MGKNSIAANHRYRAKAYDCIQFVVAKGMRDRYRELAESQGDTLSGLIKRLLDAEWERSQRLP